MNWATEIAMLERAVQAESASPDGIDVSALGPIFEDMRKCINPEDRRLVLARCDELFAVFSEEEAQSSEPEDDDFDEDE